MTKYTVCILLLFASVCGAATKYVNGSGGNYTWTQGPGAGQTGAAGSDAADGSVTTPWLTLTYAESTASAADVIYVAPATYTMATYLTSNKAMSWIGDAGAATTIMNSTGTSRVLYTTATGASYTGFTIDGGTTDNFPIYLTGNSNTWTSCVVKDCVAGGNLVCISTSASPDDNVFISCTFSSSTTAAVLLNWTSNTALDATFTNCTITAPGTRVFTATTQSAAVYTFNGSSTTVTGAISTGNWNMSATSKLILDSISVTTGSNTASFVIVPGDAEITDCTFSSAHTFSDAALFRFSGADKSVTFTGNTVTYSDATGSKAIVSVVDSDPVLISDNVLTHTGTGAGSCIILGSTGTTMSDIDILNNTCSTKGTGAVIMIGSDTTGAGDGKLNGAVVRRNTVYGPLYYDRTLTGIGVHGIMYGFSVSGTISANLIDGTGCGMVLKGSGADWADTGGVFHNLFRNNYANNNDTAASLLLKGVQNVHIANNTVYINPSYSTSASSGLIHLQDNGGETNSTGIHLYNNILFGKDGQKLIRVDNDGSALEACNYNCYWNSAGSGMDFEQGGTSYTSFAAWQALGWDANSISANPLWVTAGSNFHLQSSSPCINTGTDLGTGSSYLDMDGVNPDNEGSGWEMGAYQYPFTGIPPFIMQPIFIGAN